MTFVLEEFFNGNLICNCIKYIRCQSDHVFQRFVEEMSFDSKLQLSDVLSGNTLIIEFE